MDFSTTMGNPIPQYNSDEKRKGNYYYKKQTKETQPNKLKLGEIVKGEILDKHFDTIATVKLPIGTLRAELSGKLEKGDVLHFIVQEIEPTLVLKVYSVQVQFKSHSLLTDSIIRILDLPSNKFFISFIEHIKTKRNIILRDFAFSAYDSFMKLTDADYKTIPAKVLFDCLAFFADSNLEFSKNAFNEIKFAFFSINYIAKQLKKLEDKFKDYNSVNLLNYKRKIDAIDNSLKAKNFFTIQPDAFCTDILTLEVVESQGTPKEKEIVEIIKEIYFISIAKEAVKVLLLGSGAVYSIIIPYRDGDIFKIVEIYCDIFSSPPKYKFSAEISEQKINVIIEFYKETAKIKIYTKNKSEDLLKYVENMKNEIIDKKINCSVEFYQTADINIYSDMESGTTKNKTYVI